MDRKELLELLDKGPVRILMNDGNSYTVASPRESIVTDISAHVLYRDSEDGKLRAMILPLVTMSGVEQLSEAEL